MLVEILTFGNEILIGEIVNTNTSWLAKELTLLGAKITRMSTASDDLLDLENTFLESFARKPDIIISTGGLGPTWDDRTLTGLSKALNEDLILNEEALSFIKNKYSLFNIQMSEAAEKMAYLPKNGKYLNNKFGTAPGLCYQYQKITIFCFPGVPKEMKEMFAEHIIPFLATFSSTNTFLEEKFLVYDLYESKLAAVTKKFTSLHPEIYIKSHPNGHIKMHITAWGDAKTKELMTNVVIQLKIDIEAIGGLIKEIYY